MNEIKQSGDNFPHVMVKFGKISCTKIKAHYGRSSKLVDVI